MIKVNDLSFYYRRNRTVLKNISLEIKQGRIYGLLGKNGEGKTTLLNIMCGMLYPKSGGCRVWDCEPASRKVDFLQKIFLLPEEIYLPDVKAREYFSINRPFYPAFSEDILRRSIDALEIDMDMKLKKMSLGQKKKAAIALALAANTPLLLMDEPTNGLDIPSKAVFRKLLSSVMSSERTVLISTHQVRDLESLIDSVIILDNKEILLSLSLEEIGSGLEFRIVEEGEETFYEEQSAAGRVGVMRSRSGSSGAVSLELLFNAAIASGEEIKQLFNCKNK